jgi:hypothetical protein
MVYGTPQLKAYLTPTLKGFAVRNENCNLTLDPSFDYNSCIQVVTFENISNGILGAQIGACLPFQLRL